MYQGDNRVTVANAEHGLHNVADRVCLGLLPSSVAGWPLAVECLKPAGGLMHVHENVRDVEIGRWVEDTCQTFEALFVDAGKPMVVTVRGVERVKSYAPHVIHIVADLVCTPRGQN